MEPSLGKIKSCFALVIELFLLSLVSTGELQPATAFMTGKLKLSGDLAKALSLEAVMKASREARLAKEAADGKRGFHTSAGRST